MELAADLFPDYSIFCSLRKTQQRGGVAIPTLKKYNSKILKEITGNIDDIEANFAEISFPRKQIVIGSLYRPPNTKFSNFLSILNKNYRIEDQDPPTSLSVEFFILT